MALSRLSNLGANPTGVVLYVDPSNFDATDNIENRGISPLRPFSSIQRALLEAALYSFQPGRNNDRNDRTTILVSPGTHYIDNRPGFSIQNISNSAVFKKRTGKDTWTTASVNPLSETSNFDIFNPNNDLYKFNSVYGGLILPRGTSIVGQDLRKTKIRPLYVPDPLDSDVDRSSILNVTGGCYFSTFTFFDADVTKFSYKNYSDSKHVPKYSHHKLTTFVYADGVNKVRLGLEQTNLTDLEMYYYKVSHAYNTLSGRNIPDYPSSLDFEPNIDEFRIVGALQENPIGISSIRSGNGDGTGDNSVITVTTANLQTKIEQPHNFFVDTPIIIKGITVDTNSYNGSFTVREVVGLNTFTFITPVVPQTTALPSPSTFETAIVSVESDTVSSSSPYIFNCSLRSVYGMCGMWADGSKADGFKSMVVAQYTGISLQKDDDAYLIYDDKSFLTDVELKQNPNKVNLRPLHQNSRAIYKPEFENFHIRASNDSFIQCVSIFAIGFAKHFVTESGADMSITNSNSNFGSNALNSVGFRNVSFDRDDVGYVTHIIPPEELNPSESEINWLQLDIAKIKLVANSTKFYLTGFTNRNTPPDTKVENYKVGARLDDKLYINVFENGVNNTYSAPICMTVPVGTSNIVSKKEYKVQRTNNINEITNNILTFTENHKLHNGERIRIFSDDGHAPDGLEVNKIYYAITNGVNANQIKIASTLSDTESGISIDNIKNNGGIVSVVSTVTDKKPGELGHPIQWDNSENQWYLTVGQSNEIYNKRNDLLNLNPTTFIKRLEDNRLLDDRIYKFRYVIPKEFDNAKPPQVGFVLEETKNIGITTYYDTGVSLTNSTQLRNPKIIVNASTGAVINGSQIVTITTELPHNFIIGDKVKIQNITSTNNPSAAGIVSTYNGEYDVLSVPSSREFTYKIDGVKINPGTFSNNINQRTTSQQKRALPLVSRTAYKNNFYIYGVDTVQSHISGSTGKDGIYYLKVLSASVEVDGNIGYGLSEKSFRQDVRNLYPQLDRDNALSNPNATTSYADLINIGRVITDDKKKSITLETVNKFNSNNRIGFGITNVVISGSGNTTITLFTDVEHKLNSIKTVGFVTTGSNYTPSSTFYARNLIDTKFNEEDSTCKYSTNSSGQVITTSFSLVDVGSAHTVGERLGISGGSPNAIVEVTELNNNIGDGLELFDFQTTNINGIYEIVSIPNKKTIVLHAPSGITTYVPNTSGRIPIGYLASNGVSISSVNLANLTTGIATVSTTLPHGLASGNKFKFVNSNISYYNKDFIVEDVVGINTFTFNVGVATTTSTPTTGKILKYGISSNALNLQTGEDNLASRGCYIYDKLTTTLTSALSLNEVETINVSNSNGFNKGDFILINNEIFRIKLEPSGNVLKVLRSQLGTSKTSADLGSIVRKIKVLPMETRRPSYMRASGHTFEYLGFGPGNYSTSLPQRQDRLLSEDEILTSQAKREQGGVVVYTGMNDLGEFFTGSKKSSTITNKETTIDAPVISYTGDDVDGELEEQESGVFDNIFVRNNILVEGSGSQFFGTVEFKDKLTNHSDKGISVRNLFIKNKDISSLDKLISVGNTTANISNPNSGDIIILDNPSNHIGYTYDDNSWRKWGLVSIEPNILNIRVDRLGIGASANSNYAFNVSGVSSVSDIFVNGSAEFKSNVVFSNATFSNLNINRTATFSGIGTDFTQVHTQGTSRLFNLQVVGVSTFTGISTFNSNVDINNLTVRKNINVGVADSNTISAQNGNLRLISPNGRVNVASDLSVTSNEVSITTSRSSGFATAFITDSRILRLGVGNTNQSSYIDLSNDTRTFSDYGLRIVRNSGIGSQSSNIIHRGNQPLNINAFDNGADVKILTNNTDRLIVGSSGIVTYTQNNSGQNLLGAHFRINQRGIGDAALSWDCPDLSGNPSYRWYVGIDTSDGYSWKLANPSTLIAYGSENFDTDYKLKISNDSTLTLFNSGFPNKTLTINQGQIQTSESSFNLINTNSSTVNAFGAATALNMGASTGTATINNATVTLANSTIFNINGTNPTLASSSTGTLTLFNTNLTSVNAFGAATTLNIGAVTGTATIRNQTLTLSNATSFNINGVNPVLASSSTGTLTLFNTNLTSVNAFGAATTITMGATTGTTTVRNKLTVGGNLEIDGNIIQSSTGADVITLNSNNATFANNLIVNGNIGVNVASPSQRLDVSGSIRASSQIISTVATGTAPLQVTSTTKVNNLNVDFLDDQTGSYYLDYNNFTNRPTIGNGSVTVNTSGTGLSGSGSFTLNQTENLTITLSSNATSANTPSTIVARDSNGGFSVGTINSVFIQSIGNNPTNNVWGGSIQIREINSVGNTITSSDYAPGLTFHWSNVTASAIKMYNEGSIRFIAQNSTGADYRDIYSSNHYIRNISPTLYLQDTNGRSCMLHCNDNSFYVLRGSGNDSTTWQQFNGRWPLQIDLQNNDAFFGGIVEASTPQGTTGGVRIRANADTGISRLQFTNSAVTSEFLNVAVTAGMATFTGNITINNSSPILALRDTDHRSGAIHCNGNIFYILRGDGTNSTTYSPLNGYWPLAINLNDNQADFGGSVYLKSGFLQVDGATSPGGDAIRITNGGDLRIFNNANNGSANLYCDTNEVLQTSGNFTANGTITATTFSGNGTIPVGGIIMWNGTISDAIALEPGWALCDGRTVNGKTTPILTDKFIVGATSGGDNVYPGLGVNETGGSANATLVAHSHGSGAPQGGFALANTGTRTDQQTITNIVSPQSQGTIVTSTASAGSGDGTNANLPPYYALAFIMRTS